MGDSTGIEWTDGTWNAWWGCQKVGPGCDNCYAEALDRRTGGAHWGAKADRRRTSVQNWNAPLRWQRQADAFEAEHGRRRRVFCGSMMDIMDNAVPLEWSHEAFARIEECDRIDWQLLTKRAGNVADRIPDHWKTAWPRHVGLMITVVNQEEADRDIWKLLEFKGRYRIPWVGLSMEPLLGPVDLTSILISENERLNALSGELRGVLDGHTAWHKRTGLHLDWVIVGGESGPGARPMHPDWARSILRQCAVAGVPFMFKQWGDWFPFGGMDAEGRENTVSRGKNPSFWHEWGDGEISVRLGKKAAGRYLYGTTHDGFPGAPHA